MRPNLHKNSIDTAGFNDDRLEELADQPLNHNRDRVPDIDPQLRQLNLELGLKTAMGVISAPSAFLLSGAVGFFLKRRFAAASFFAAGFFLRQILTKQRPVTGKRSRQGARRRSDIEIERYALKAQRGDYGKLEVIPFK